MTARAARLAVLLAALLLPEPHGAGAQDDLPLTTTIHNNSTRTLFILADAKTTIKSYTRAMRQMARSPRAPDVAGQLYVSVEPGSSVGFESTGNFLTHRKDEGQTFWAATGCDPTKSVDSCDWNGDRTQGAVLEWNMFDGTLYYDISAVDAMDELVYSMSSSCFPQPSTCARILVLPLCASQRARQRSRSCAVTSQLSVRHGGLRQRPSRQGHHHWRRNVLQRSDARLLSG